MKKRNSQTIKRWGALIATLLILPVLAVMAAPLFAGLTAAPNTAIGSIGNQAATVGSTVSLQLEAPGAASFTAAPLPGGLSINGAGLISGNLSTAQVIMTTAEAKNITGTVIATETFQWTISAANNPPAFTSTPSNQITARFEKVSIQLQANDGDGDTLTYSKVGSWPNGMTINSATGLIGGSTNVVGGPTDVTAKVTDGNGGEDTVTFQVTVKHATQLGNDAVSVSGDGVDSTPSNMVINLSDAFTNYSNSTVKVYITQFSFHAKNPNVPITPFLVKVADGVPISNYDFTVVKIGATRSTYDAGDVFFNFGFGSPSVNLAPGETLLPGFIDADKNGNNGVNGNGDGGTVARVTTGDQIWYSYSSSASPAGFSIVEGQPPNPVIANGNPFFRTDFTRNYAFNITLGTDSPPQGPPPTPTPEPTVAAPWQIKNGSFEEDSNGNKKSSLTDWDVIGEDGVDVKSNIASEGAKSIDMNTSTISQTVEGLTPNQPYVLRIDYIGNTGSGIGTTADASVFINNSEMAMGLNPGSAPKGIHSNEQSDWVVCNGFEFTPLTSTATIVIQSDETGAAPNGLRIDNVRLVEGMMPLPPEHDYATLEVELGGWRALANGDFEAPITPSALDPENTGPDFNPHLCGNSLPDWRITRESIDLIKRTTDLPPGSEAGDEWIIDVGGQGPGGIAQTITGLTPNAQYILKFYAARHIAYQEQGDMTGQLWSNGMMVKEIVRTLDQMYDSGYQLEQIPLESDENGKITFELFSTIPEKSGNIVYDNFSIIAQADQPTLTPPDDQLNNIGDSPVLELVISNPNSIAYTYSASGLPPTLEINENTGTISGTVTTAGDYAVTVNVIEASVSETFNWTVNTPPVIDSIADQAATDGDMVEIDASATDADSDPIVFSIDGQPFGVDIITDTGKITGTIDGFGTYTVTVTADDGRMGIATETFVWDVNAKPQLPDVGDQTTNLNQSATLSVAATDADSSDLTYTISGLPAGLDYNSATGAISGTVTTAGTTTVMVTVEDGDDGEDSISFEWLVNSVPTIVSAPSNQSNNVGDSPILAVSASDPDSDDLTYSAVNLPDGLSINAQSGIISGTLTAGGLFNVMVTADDGNGGQASASFNWDVNAAPTVTNPGDQSSSINSTVMLDITAADSDGDTLMYSASGLPAGLSISETTGKISGTATPLGTYSVTVTVTDPDGLTASASFSWLVNTPPAFTSNPGDQTGERGDDVSLTLTATDADGDTVMYSATGLPSGLMIDENTGEISGKLLSGGQFTSIITASDGKGGDTSITILWDIDGIVVPAGGLLEIYLPVVIR